MIDLYRIDPDAVLPQHIDRYHGHSVKEAWRMHENEYLAFEKDGAIILAIDSDGADGGIAFRRVKHEVTTTVRYA
jgi:hypothetical protein